MARVLIVEDDEDVRGVVTARLKQAGHRVVSAATAAAALALVGERGAPEVAVLDVSLPDTSGLELLQRLRDQSGVSRLPAVFLSGRVEPADISAGRALSAQYLTKPFVASALLSAIERALATEAPVVVEDGW